MATIQGPITFKKGQPLPDKMKEAIKQNMGLREIKKEEVGFKQEVKEESKELKAEPKIEQPKVKPKKAKAKKSKKKA
jgi:hypothetical protein